MTTLPEASTVPHLSGEKIMLRRLTPSDLALLTCGERQSDWAADFPQPGDLDAVGTDSAAGSTSEASRYGAYLVVEQGTGRVVGTAGFQGPPIDGEAEIGYGITPTARRRGYATECVKLLLDFARTDTDLTTVTAHTEELNVPSQTVLLNAGFMPVETAGPYLTFQRTLAGSPSGYIGT